MTRIAIQTSERMYEITSDDRSIEANIVVHHNDMTRGIKVDDVQTAIDNVIFFDGDTIKQINVENNGSIMVINVDSDVVTAQLIDIDDIIINLTTQHANEHNKVDVIKAYLRLIVE